MMTIAGPAVLAVALLAGGCGMVKEVAAPAPGNISEIRRPASPNTCLAGPAGFMPTPYLQTRRFDMAPERLLAIMRDILLMQPRTAALAADPGRLRADYVVRSRVFGFPDIVLVQALPVGTGQSELVLYSYSLQGHYDFGVNRNRVTALLTALDAELAR